MMRKVFNFCNILLFKNLEKKEIVEPCKIILVSNTALGDTILSTPAIKSIRLRFPDANIILLVHQNLFSFFQEFEYVDQVMAFSSSLPGLTRQALSFRRKEFDTVFFLHSNGPQDLFFAMVSGANNILKAINFPGAISKEFQKIMINTVDSNTSKHIIEHRLDLVRFFNPSILDKSLSIPSKDNVNANINPSPNIIALQLSAADIYKVWPLSNFLDLMVQVVESLNSNCSIILLGINSEVDLSNKFEENFKYPNLIQNFCGKTSLKELQSILHSASLLITNDTGTLHLAVAVKTPTISLFAPTDPNVFGPYQDFNRHKVVKYDGSYINNNPKKQRTQEAMSFISIDDAFEAFNNIKKDFLICAE